LFAGRVIDADDARDIRLVSRVVPHDDLLSTALTLTADIAGNPPLAEQALKRGLRTALGPDWGDLGRWVSATLAELFRTDDHRDGVAAFLEKRPANHNGRWQHPVGDESHDVAPGVTTVHGMTSLGNVSEMSRRTSASEPAAVTGFAMPRPGGYSIRSATPAPLMTSAVDRRGCPVAEHHTERRAEDRRPQRRNDHRADHRGGRDRARARHDRCEHEQEPASTERVFCLGAVEEAGPPRCSRSFSASA